MAIRNGRILFVIFIVSVSLVPLIETGHSLLHSFNNPFHHHTVRRQGTISNHTINDHHFSKMQFAYEMDEAPSTTNNFIVLAYAFYQTCFNLSTLLRFTIQQPNTVVTESLYAVYFCPPSPPPLTGNQS